MLNTEIIGKLAEIYSDDSDMLETLYEQLEIFQGYFKAIYLMETKMKIFTREVLDVQEYQSLVSSMDKKRTLHHNEVIAAVKLLNRMAEQEGLEPVYDGVVSEERPYRRQVANAVIAYMEYVVNNRR